MEIVLEIWEIFKTNSDKFWRKFWNKLGNIWGQLINYLCKLLKLDIWNDNEKYKAFQQNLLIIKVKSM